MHRPRCVSRAIRSRVSFLHRSAHAETLERRTLLASTGGGIVVGVTPGSTAAGIALVPLAHDHDGAVMYREYGTALPIGPAPRSAPASPASAAGAFDIVLNMGPGLTSLPEAAAAFEQAAAFMESLFSDPVTVVIDAEFAPLGGTTLGRANSVVFGQGFDSLRNRVVADAHASDEAFVADLPTEETFFSHMPGGFSLSGMAATRANLLALGMSPAQLDGPNSVYDPSVDVDATITFSSEYPWDYDRADGISPNLNDFVGIAIHEIGHALGFNSAVDQVDNRPSGPVAPTPLDLFRVEPGAGGAGFGGVTRVLAPGNTIQHQVLYDGGRFDPAGITSIPGLALGDVPLSTGVFNGDGEQAGHWKDDAGLGGRAAIGIMHPRATTGRQQVWTAADERAFGLIGWDTTPAAPVATASGTVFDDANGNGARDAGEAGLAGWTVYDDANNNGQVDGAAAAASTDVPKTIPDQMTARSNLSIANVAGTLTDVDVSLSIEHTYNNDLVVTLVAPDGTRVPLIDRVFDSNQGFTDTVLDDAAGQAIEAGAAPFTGRYRPARSLSDLNGKTANGTWQLEARDAAQGDSGRIVAWSIHLTTSAVERTAVTNASGDYTLSDLPVGPHTLRQVVQTGFAQTFPGPAGHAFAIAEGEQVTGRDFGNRALGPTGVSGHVYRDADADGTRDPGETGIAGVIVYDDVNDNGVFDRGQSEFGYTGSDRLIPDPGTVSVPITVSGVGGTVGDVDVMVDITHPWVSDVSVTLVSPSGTRALLFADLRLEEFFPGEDFLGTILDDEADFSIEEGLPPYSSTYRPMDSLSGFDGEPVDGTWLLEVSDVDGGAQGFLNTWGLTFTGGDAEPSTVSDFEGLYEFNGLAPGLHRIRQVVPDGETQTEPPNNGAHVVTLTEGLSVPGRNFGNTDGVVAASVVGRHVFYNNSAFDGWNPAAGAADDAAIATDKQALLPGTTATFANYTSYTRGINGVMVDVANLPAGGALGVLDFSFFAGNDDSPGFWALVAEPTLNVRRGAGVNGSDRITFTWPDGTIVGRWLKVTVIPTPNTGLDDGDVFYFGNLPGETGNSAASATVSAADYLRTRANALRTGAGITNAYDFNRDGRVDLRDRATARARVGRSLHLVTASAAVPSLSLFGTAGITATSRGAYRPPHDLLS